MDNEQPPAPTPAQLPQPDTGLQALQADLDKWKALARKHEADWKSSQQTIADLQGQLSAKDTDLQARQADLLRYRVGVAQGVPPALIERLRGSTEQELLDDAKGLLESIPKPDPGPSAPPPTPLAPDASSKEEAFAAFMGPALNP